MSLKIVSAYGAAYQQGLGVVKSLLDDYKVQVRVLPDEEFQNISHPNLTVVQIGIDGSSTLVAAIKGSWAVFADSQTNYIKPEGTQTVVGSKIVNAVAETGVE